MYTLLLIVIYIAFIGLGLPDSLLGSGWPVMHISLGAGIDFAGIISMIIAASTVFSSLLSDRLTYRFGTGIVTLFSTTLSGIALLGFSLSNQLWQIIAWSVPYGLCAGAIDSSLNNYVALHYNSRSMSWLHCFWGVGASISPYIMASFLSDGNNWNGAYRAVSIIEFSIAFILLCTLFLWRTNSKSSSEDEKQPAPLGLKHTFQIKGVSLGILSFFAYCTAEQACSLWASSYLVTVRNIPTVTAARFASLFFLGITFGRFLNGFIVDRIGDRKIVRFSMLIMLFSVVLILLPIKTNIFALGGFLLFGIGCAPVFPCLIHLTPDTFGKENSQAVIGVQMASCYFGTALMPTFLGFLARIFDMTILPYFMLLFVIILFFVTEKLRILAVSKG